MRVADGRVDSAQGLYERFRGNFVFCVFPAIVEGIFYAGEPRYIAGTQDELDVETEGLRELANSTLIPYEYYVLDCTGKKPEIPMPQKDLFRF